MHCTALATEGHKSASLEGCQRGDAVLQGKREAVIAVYEAKPLISDHKVANGMGPLHDIS